ARDQPPIVVGLVIVHVDSVAVHVLAEAVSRPVNELRAESRPFDDVAARAIDLVSAEIALLADRGLDEVDRGVAPVPDGGKGARIGVRHLASGEAHPRDVSKDRARPRQLTPEVDEDDLVGLNGAMLLTSREVVRIARVLLRRD